MSIGMTLYKPQIAINRLRVIKGGETVFDQDFDYGVNIVRGENGSGKTTVSDFIFHIMGGEVYQWRESAKHCDTVVGELSINDEIVTVRRDIDAGRKKRPMFFYWGEMKDSWDSSLTEWEKYPYSTTETKGGFSSVLFDLLDIPDVKGFLDSRVTMHQILRLMYVDQLTPYDQVFLDEQFDQQITRKTVGDLLCGIYDEDLYEVQILLDEKEKELSSVRASLKSIREVLGDISDEVSIEQFVQRRDQLQTERSDLYDSLESLSETDSEATANGEYGELTEVRERLREVQQHIEGTREKIEELSFEITDSERFIEALQRRMESLGEASSVRAEFDSMPFNFCPACYAKISDDQEEGTCDLCKNDLEDSDSDAAHRLKRERELETQIDESRQLQEDRIREKESLESELGELVERRNDLQERFDDMSSSVSSTEEKRRQEIYKRIGYINREIEDINEKIEMFKKLEDIKSTRDELVSRVEDLRNKQEVLEEERDKRKVESYNVIERLCKRFLREDIDTEENFTNPDRISFDFAKDIVYVDGRDNYAASSMTYLKNSFHLALFGASLEKKYFRYPRFVLFDNIEDKGMTPKRSHNFQQRVVNFSNEKDVKKQVILTTSMFNEDLSGNYRLVGPEYTSDNKTLNL